MNQSQSIQIPKKKPKHANNNKMTAKDNSSDLISAIEANIKSKQAIKATILDSLSLSRESLCYHEENKVLENEIQVLKQKINILHKENSGCFKEYQETLEGLEEIYAKRRLYIEGHYKELLSQLSELQLRESLIDQKFLQLQREKTLVSSDNLAILYTYTQKKLTSTSFFQHLFMLVVISALFYFILI